MPSHLRLYINVDHVATVRQARRTDEPDPVAAARLCEDAGADGITAHLREDRRHMQDHDVERLARETNFTTIQGPAQRWYVQEVDLAATADFCNRK